MFLYISCRCLKSLELFALPDCDAVAALRVVITKHVRDASSIAAYRNDSPESNFTDVVENTNIYEIARSLMYKTITLAIRMVPYVCETRETSISCSLSISHKFVRAYTEIFSGKFLASHKIQRNDVGWKIIIFSNRGFCIFFTLYDTL